jgi:hypothetical protein
MKPTSQVHLQDYHVWENLGHHITVFRACECVSEYLGFYQCLPQ